jgi:tetratricopeptide (TPR) repeat protein
MKANKRDLQRQKPQKLAVLDQQGVPYQRYVLLALLLSVLAGFAFSIARYVSRTSTWQQVQASLERRDLENAGRQLVDFLELYPNDRQALLVAAQTSRRRGKFDEAAQFLKAHERLEPGNSDAQLERRLLRIQQGDLSAANGLLSGAKEQPGAPRTSLALEAIIEGYMARFWSFATRQVEVPPPEYSQAQGAVDLWLRQQPLPAAQVRGLVWRGKLAALVRDYDASEAAFRSALAIDPVDLEASEYLGLLLAQDAPQEAAAFLERVHDQNPQNDKVSFGLASVRRALGEQSRAVEVIDGLLARNPRNASYLLERGRLELDQQRPEEAVVWLQRALRVAPDYGPANLMLSICLEQMGRSTEAEHFRERFTKLASPPVKTP